MPPFADVTLEGTHARLVPLSVDHTEALYHVAQDPVVWRYLPNDYSGSLDAMHAWMASALQDKEDGVSLPFAIIRRTDDLVVGATRYLDIKPTARGLEIGHTWLGTMARRTGINTECKFLLLQHAFEVLDQIRVQLKTDERNTVSQRAIERIGATREGVLRKFQVLSNGYQRNTVMYSIIDSEWPTVKAHLQHLLDAYA